MLRTFLTGIFAIVFTVAFSQAKYIKVSGKITDASNNEPLVKASIIIEGLQKGTSTDVEGNFFLTLEAGKKYTIKVTSIGYQTKLLTDYQALQSDNAVLNITLARASKEVGEVVIRTTAKKETAASLYTVQKNSSSISDAISAEVIKKSPDRNTSEVLRRVSGTSIQDNKFVIIRGLSERYNSSMLNNTVLPSTEPDKKAFSFDIIPSSLIDNIVVYKSSTPDLPGDFSGGAVKISTRDYPSKQLSDLSFSVGYNSLTTFKNFYKGNPDGKLDWLGFFDNSRLIPRSYYKYRGAAYSNLSENTKLAITKQFPNTYGMQVANQSQPNFNFSYTGGNTKFFKKNDNKLGYIYAINYNNGRRVADRTRDEFESYDFHNYSYTTTNYDKRSSLSALLNLSYSIDGKSKISLKNLFNNDFVSSFAQRKGVNTVNAGEPFYYKSQNTEATANGIGSSVLEGIHNLKKELTIDWNASYTLTYRWQPDQHYMTFVSDPNTENYFLKLNNENSPVITEAGRIYSYLHENIYGANLNVTKQFMWKGEKQKLKFGTSNYYRDRTVEVNALGLASASFYGLRIPETKTTTFGNIMSADNIDNYKFFYANIPANSTDYTGTVLMNSAYAMMDNKFGSKIKLTWGVRAERYLQEFTAKGKPTITKDNIDVLPSALLTYSLTKKSNLRFSGSQTVNRPEFRELATYRSYDFENNYIVQGNNNLVRCKNTNADFRYEWFPASGEIISTSVFYKYFQNPIEQSNLNNDVLGYVNADAATVYGIELEVRKKLDFIPSSLFSHMVFYSNAAYIKGSVKFNGQTFNSPLQGQSPYLINTGLTYTTENDKLSFNILYNRIGERLKFRAATSAGRNIFEKSRDVLDFQVSKKFLSNRLEAKFTISDIFAQPYSWYYKYEANPSSTKFNAATDRVINSYRFGTSCSIGLKYSFTK